MWRLCKLGYRHEPRLLLASFLLSLLAALPDSLVAVWLKVLGDGVLHTTRGRVLAAAVGLGVSAPPPGSCEPSAPACSGGSATKSRSRSNRMSQGSRRRPRQSSTRSGPSISTGWRCCATRCSCSITCICRCSRPARWILRLGVTVALLVPSIRRYPARCLRAANGVDVNVAARR